MVNASKQEIHRAWFIMIACCLMMAGSVGIVANGAGLFFKPVGDELGISRGAISFYLTIHTIVMMLMAPVAGRVLSKYNIKTVLAIAIILQGVTFASMGTFNHVTSWYWAALLLGACNTFIVFLPVPILINNWFKTKVGFAMGIALACSGLGGAVFNAIGGSMIASYGWRSAYTIMGGLAILIALPGVLIFVRSKPSDVGLEPYGADKAGADNSKNVVDLSRGISFRNAVRSPVFYFCVIFAAATSLAANFQLQIVSFAVSVGFDIAKAGIVGSCLMLGALCGKIIIGWLNDRVGTTFALYSGIVVWIIGIILLLGAGKSNTFVFAGSYLYGMGFATLSVSPALLVRRTFGPREYAAIFGIVTSGISLSSAVGSYMYGFLFDVAGTYTLGLTVAVGCILVAALALLLALKFKKDY